MGTAATASEDALDSGSVTTSEKLVAHAASLPT
jgi:hypothetical protein